MTDGLKPDTVSFSLGGQKYPVFFPDNSVIGVDTLADGTLYELRVSVADGGAFDLSEAEKEIKISVVLAK